MQQLSFRKASKDDVEQIVALVNSAYRGESSRAGWTTEADFLDGQRTDREEVGRLIEQADSFMLLCLRDAELIGIVHLEKTGASAQLGMFTVKPTLQGQGIGTQFMQAAERAVQTEWGVQRIVMAVIALRSELIAFYERRGYRRTGELKEFPTDPRFGIPRVAELQFELLEKRLRA